MNKNLKKKILSLAILMFLFVPALALVSFNPAQAQTPELDIGLVEIDDELNLGNADPRETAGKLINTAMLFLGLIAVVIILLAGFKWMTAGGSEDKVSEAKRLMGQGVIGLVIILASWGIATFVISQLGDATGVTITGGEETTP